MLTKQQFIEQINFIKDYDYRTEKYEDALKQFAPSDFTGYYDSRLHDHLVDTLISCVGEYLRDVIEWWIYDCRFGQDTDLAKITVNPDTDDEKTVDVSNVSDLYDYLIEYEFADEPSVADAEHAQTEGVRYAISIIDEQIKSNRSVHNPDWKVRQALLTFVAHKIANEYRLATGIDPNYEGDIELITEK